MLNTWVRFLLYATLFALTPVLFTGCKDQDGEEIKSLCIPNFVDKVCWFNKKEGIGLTFDQLALQQIECKKENTNIACYYMIDGHDIKRIADKLSECRHGTSYEDQSKP